MANMLIDESAFKAFMAAYHEHGGTGLGFRKCLVAYEAAKDTNLPVSIHRPEQCKQTDTLIELMGDLLCDAYEAGIKREGWAFKAAKDKLRAAVQEQRGEIPVNKQLYDALVALRDNIGTASLVRNPVGRKLRADADHALLAAQFGITTSEPKREYGNRKQNMDAFVAAIRELEAVNYEIGMEDTKQWGGGGKFEERREKARAEVSLQFAARTVNSIEGQTP